jgi:hypothetical protein
MIWRSILLLSYDKYFCQVFGKEKILMEMLAERSNAAWVDLTSTLNTCYECCEATTTTVRAGGKKCIGCMIVFMKDLPVDNDTCLNCNRNNCISNRRCRHCFVSYRKPAGVKDFAELFYCYPSHVYRSVVHVDVPESLSNPKHFGHLTWKFCEFMASLEGTNIGAAAAEVCLLVASLEGTDAGAAATSGNSAGSLNASTPPAAPAGGYGGGFQMGTASSKPRGGRRIVRARRPGGGRQA